jgi:hypothetical protein
MTDNGSLETSLLRAAHKGTEAMSAAAALINQEQWIEAERALAELQSIATELAKLVAEKARSVTPTPNPDQGDRG